MRGIQCCDVGGQVYIQEVYHTHHIYTLQPQTQSRRAHVLELRGLLTTFLKKYNSIMNLQVAVTVPCNVLTTVTLLTGNFPLAICSFSHQKKYLFIT